MSPSDPQPAGTVMRTVLYVEDNRANLQLVEQMVALRSDISFLGASDAMSGIALARSHRPQVILMDINLPNISGIEAMKILRQEPATQHIPVLALSAHAMPDDIANCLAQGFFSYLTKPFKINDFMRMLDLALEFSEKTSRLAGGRTPRGASPGSALQAVLGNALSLAPGSLAPKSSHCSDRSLFHERDTGALS